MQLSSQKIYLWRQYVHVLPVYYLDLCPLTLGLHFTILHTMWHAPCYDFSLHIIVNFSLMFSYYVITLTWHVCWRQHGDSMQLNSLYMQISFQIVRRSVGGSLLVMEYIHSYKSLGIVLKSICI